MRNHHIRIALITLLGLFILSCSHIYKQTDIHGTWQGTYNGKKILFVFNTDKTCEFKFMDEQSNITETINGNYELDLTKKPIPMSIRNIPQLSHPLHTIMEFVNGDSIRIADFSPRWRLRPVSFNNGKTMFLKRVVPLN